MIITVWPFQSSRTMSLYTVHEPPEPAVDRIERAEQMLFLKDGFNWSAFIMAPVWLVMNRVWLGAALYIAAIALVVGVVHMFDADPRWISATLVGLHAIIGFEAHALQALDLDRRGWANAGSVMGTSEAECERRFFEHWLPTQAPLRNHPAVATSPQTGVPNPTVEAVQPSPHKKWRFAFWRR